MNDRDQNRADFPKLAEMVDMVRSTCPDVKLVGGIEEGREIGKVSDELRELYREAA
ncbi:MAG: hypothetical protein WKF61_06160 [Luteimonas sp.]